MFAFSPNVQNGRIGTGRSGSRALPQERISEESIKKQSILPCSGSSLLVYDRRMLLSFPSSPSFLHSLKISLSESLVSKCYARIGRHPSQKNNTEC